MEGAKLKVAVILLFLCCDGVFAGFFDIWTLDRLLKKETKKSPVESKKTNGLDFINLVQRHGYPAEEYTVQSSDGYILRFHRIPGSPRSPKFLGKPVVYIQHGILASSDMFVVAGPRRDLAYILADAGYDVWLGNARGNVYSRAHVKLNPDSDKEFWEFSMHEIALYDVSTTIDYILHTTGQLNLIYVGHSMGSTISLILLSMKPEFNNKIRLVVNLGTVGNWKNTRNFMRLIYDNGPYVVPAINAAGVTEVFPRTLTTGKLTNSTCRDGGLLQQICLNALQYICGYNSDLLDSDLLAKGLIYFPAGASWQTMYHYYQNIVKGRLLLYDYGMIENFAKYGQFTPPAYNLKDVSVPVFMLYGKNDALAAPEDSIDLANILRYGRAESVSHEKFNHLDFVWSKNVENIVHNRILEIITKFTYHGRRLEEL